MLIFWPKGRNVIRAGTSVVCDFKPSFHIMTAISEEFEGVLQHIGTNTIFVW
jgi:NADH:ubiquinone oxidoreductase subunit E